VCSAVMIVFFVVTEEMTPEYVAFVHSHVFNREVFIIVLFWKDILRTAVYVRCGFTRDILIVLAQFTIVYKGMHHLNSS